MSKKVRNILLYLLLLAACVLVTYQFVHPRPTGMDVEYPMWYHLRVFLYGTAASMVIAGIAYAAISWKRIVSFLPTLIQYRHLLYLMVKHSLSTKYRGSILGVLWSFLDPLFNMAVMALVFSTILVRKIEYFPAFLFTGNMIFGCFNDTVGGSMTSIVNNSKMLNKVYVPKYLFPLTKAIVAMVNVFLTMIPLMLVMLVIGAPFHWTMVLAPIGVVYVTLFSFGLGLLLATLYVFFRDIKQLWSVARTGLRYMSGIFFEISSIPVAFLPIFSANPLFHYIQFFRDLTFYGNLPSLNDHLICGGLAIVMFALGMFVFYRNQNKFILYM